MFWILYSFFWVIPRLLNFILRLSFFVPTNALFLTLSVPS
jgi:hypothetical protein